MVALNASCLLNLCATGIFGELAAGLPIRFVVSDYVLKNEALCLQVRNQSGSMIRRRLCDSGLFLAEEVESLKLVGSAEQNTYAVLASKIDDGEAVTGSLAFHRGFSLATDDRKARRVLSEQTPSVPLLYTLEILKKWVDDQTPSVATLRSAVEGMRDQANYVPGSNNPLYEWWCSAVAADI